MPLSSIPRSSELGLEPAYLLMIIVAICRPLPAHYVLQCSGDPGPCIDCQRRGIECVFDIELDGRRNVKRKRLQQSQAINHLIETIKIGDWDRLQSIRELLVQGFSVADAMSEADPPDLAPEEVMPASQALGHSQPASEDVSGMPFHSWPDLREPDYAVLPLSKPDSSPLGMAYTIYRDTARTLISHGVPVADILQAAGRTTRVDLFFRLRKDDDPHSVDNWASELSATFKSTFGVLTCLATSVLFARLLKVSPAYENSHHPQFP